MTEIGTPIEDIDILRDLFPAHEGEITQRYGRIGQGKTYGATADVIDELKRGHVVYVNWQIKWDGFDQRESFLYVLGALLFPWANKLYHFPKENLRFIAIDEHFVENFSKLTNCSVYLDEGHVVFDSYEMAKMSMAKRVSVLHTRHFDRSINIISQRPTAVHRMLRANVNRFYKYEKLMSSPFIIFRRLEYQDMLDENVDETTPLSVKLYFGRQKIFKAYNTKYLRGNMEDSQKMEFHAFNLSYWDKIKALFALTGNSMRSAFSRAHK